MVEKKMETTIVHWGYIGTMEQKKTMETAIIHWGLYWDGGKENGDNYDTLG